MRSSPQLRMAAATASSADPICVWRRQQSALTRLRHHMIDLAENVIVVAGIEDGWTPAGRVLAAS
jgi:hypothetical protein